MNLEENIKFFRKNNRLTQEKLAELVDCSVDTLQRWENGTREPRASDIKKLCEILHCTEAELLNGAGSESSKITLSYDWKKYQEGDLDMTGKGYELFLGADGVIGLKGSMLLKSKEAIKDCIAAIEEQLTVADEAQERRGVLQEV